MNSEIITPGEIPALVDRVLGHILARGADRLRVRDVLNPYEIENALCLGMSDDERHSQTPHPAPILFGAISEYRPDLGHAPTDDKIAAWCAAPPAEIAGQFPEVDRHVVATYIAKLRKISTHHRFMEAAYMLKAAATAGDKYQDRVDFSKFRRDFCNHGFYSDGTETIGLQALDCMAGVSMGTLAAAPKREVDFIVRDVVVRDQPMLVNAHEKTLKSSGVMDLAASLTTATPFLNYFDVPERMNVLYLSGENGEDGSLEVFRRVCRSKNIAAESVQGFTFATWTPKFYKPDDLSELVRRISDVDAKFVAIDPAGMCLSPGAASILSIAYDELRAVTDAVKSCGATLLLVHHATKGSNVSRLGLRSAAGAGFAEFARQWLLLDRVGQFVPETGDHRIRMTVGGSRGHSGRWTLDVREGNIADAGGRVWNVNVSPIGKLKLAASDQKVAANAAEVLEAMRTIGVAETGRRIRDAIGMNDPTFKAAVAYLLDSKAIEVAAIVKSGRERDGYRLTDGGLEIGEAA